MLIASIGIDLHHPGVEEMRFDSSFSLLDYDGVVLSLENVQHNYWSASRYRGLRSIAESDSGRLKADIQRRRGEFSEMLKLGRPVVMFSCAPQRCYIDTGRREHSGTGRNRQTTQIVEEIDILECLPVQLKLHAGSGTNIEFRGREPFATFWERTGDSLYYRAWLDDPVGSDLFFIAGTNKVVGCHVLQEQGFFLVLPAPYPPSSYEGEEEENTNQEEEEEEEEESVSLPEEYVEAIRVLTDSLLDLLAALKEESGDFSIPDWAGRFAVPEETGVRDKLVALGRRQARLSDEVAKRKETLGRIEELKLLFTGSGRALEVQARRVFEKLGFSVEDGPEGRDDFILRFGDKVAVCEVKGVGKSGAEKHAAQLEKWVSGHFEAKGTLPKGILVVNAFRETPLDKRRLPPFPKQMITYSQQRGHCLVTGIQLLGMLLAVQKEPKAGPKIARKILSTNGVLDGFDEWRSFLEVAETADRLSEGKGSPD